MLQERLARNALVKRKIRNSSSPTTAPVIAREPGCTFFLDGVCAFFLTIESNMNNEVNIRIVKTKSRFMIISKLKKLLSP